MAADGLVRVRLRPLEAMAYEYQGREDEVPVIGDLLGVPVTRWGSGDIVLSCPMCKDGDPLRTAVLTPGRLLVKFDGPAFRFTVTDPGAFKFMYEEVQRDA